MLKKLIVVVVAIIVFVVAMEAQRSKKPQPAAPKEREVWSYSQKPSWASRYPEDQKETEWLKSFEEKNMPGLRTVGGTSIYSAIERVWANPNAVQVDGQAWMRMPEKAQQQEEAKWKEYFQRKGFGDQVEIVVRN